MRRFVRVGIAIIIFAVFSVSRAQAGMITYTDEVTWLAAVGPSGIETLDGFVSDTSFQNTTVNLAGGMSVSGTTGTNGTQTQKIDVSPFEPSQGLNQGSGPNILGDVTSTGDFVRFNFATPLSAWGIDTMGIGDIAGLAKHTTINVFNSSDALLGTILTISDDTFTQKQFYGFQLTNGDTAAYVKILNDSGNPDVFGIDNIRYVAAGPAVVPEPMTLLLVGPGLAAAAVRRRRQRRS